MLDRRKVKLMIRMASHDQNHAQEDDKITSYYRSDYVSLHTLVSILWSTIGYGCLVLLFVIGWLDEIMGLVSIPVLLIIGVVVVIGYVMVVTAYVIKSENYFSDKFRESMKRNNRYEKILRRYLKICEEDNE